MLNRSHTRAAPWAALDHLPHAIAAALLGLFIVLSVGFAPLAVAHNAGHDTRHSFAFPCH